MEEEHLELECSSLSLYRNETVNLELTSVVIVVVSWQTKIHFEATREEEKKMICICMSDDKQTHSVKLSGNMFCCPLMIKLNRHLV